MEEGSDPELLLLWWLFTRHNVMPWEVYERPQGYRDLAEAFALRELELKLLRSLCAINIMPKKDVSVSKSRYMA